MKFGIMPTAILVSIPVVMLTEIYYSPYCRGCGISRLRRTDHAAEQWIDVTVHLEAAARLRITQLPAVVIDGRLIAQGPAAVRRLKNTRRRDAGGPT